MLLKIHLPLHNVNSTGPASAIVFVAVFPIQKTIPDADQPSVIVIE